MPFLNRAAAGRRLAKKLLPYANHPDVMVLGLPRGGVPVAYEVARGLHAPLDIFLVRKLGVPGQEELAFGAIGSGGVQVLNREIIESLRIPPSTIERISAVEQRELERREREHRVNRPFPNLKDRIVILVDDGLATGSTMRAAVTALNSQKLKRVVVAVPVAVRTSCEQLSDIADEVVCDEMPDDFRAVGEWYLDFSQVTDAEVRELLARADRELNVSSA